MLAWNDDSAIPRFESKRGDFSFCHWYSLKPVEKWVPKQGEMIEVGHDFKREFISMTADNKYLCWDDDKRKAHYWANAKPVKKEPVYERRWKMLIDGERGHTEETRNYFNQKDIDKLWPAWYKGRYIDVLVEE